MQKLSLATLFLHKTRQILQFLQYSLTPFIGILLRLRVYIFCQKVRSSRFSTYYDYDHAASTLRNIVRTCAGLRNPGSHTSSLHDLFTEAAILSRYRNTLRPAFELLRSNRVLFCGQAYYHAWYLSRSLRELNWKADVYNWDSSPTSQIYYHGQDYHCGKDFPCSEQGILSFFLHSVYHYDIFHFTNVNGITFGMSLASAINKPGSSSSEVRLLKALGKKIVYTNNSCKDGVSQTSFARWGPEPVCSTCRWQHEPSVCSDKLNLAWGKLRNELADYQCSIGGNRADFNLSGRVHEVPEFYCLSPKIWHPNISIPSEWKLPDSGNVRLYHAVGNLAERLRTDGKNIKSSHIYLPLVEKLAAKRYPVELLNPTGLSNLNVRYLQAQSDIILDMLSYGWFGANAREGLMLGKPVICFIRPEWLDSVRQEIPSYAEELPIISATPDTIETVLLELISDQGLRQEIGRRSRKFALKWHSDSSAAKRLSSIYSSLLAE